MSVILKSNRVLKLDKLYHRINKNPSLSLDFRDEEYMLKGESNFSLFDMVESAQPWVSSYDSNLELIKHPADTPAVSLDPISLNKGLLSESFKGNYFIGSNQPTTQQVYLGGAPFVSIGSVVFCYMEGSGYLKITRVSDNKVIGEVRETGLFTHRVDEQDTNLSPTLRYTVEVFGEVTFVSMFAQPFTNTMPVTRIETIRGQREGSGIAINTVKEDKVSAAITGNNYAFIIKVIDTTEIWPDDYNSQNTSGGGTSPNSFGVSSIRNNVTEQGLALGVGRFNSRPTLGRVSVRSSNSIEKTFVDFFGDSTQYPRTVIFGISVNGDQVTCSMNGSDAISVQGEVMRPNELALGYALGWSGARGYHKLVEQVIVYDEPLSDEELKNLTRL